MPSAGCEAGLEAVVDAVGAKGCGLRGNRAGVRVWYNAGHCYGEGGVKSLGPRTHAEHAAVVSPPALFLGCGRSGYVLAACPPRFKSNGVPIAGDHAQDGVAQPRLRVGGSRQRQPDRRASSEHVFGRRDHLRSRVPEDDAARILGCIQELTGGRVIRWPAEEAVIRAEVTQHVAPGAVHRRVQ
eukprot:scaffold3146_cov98-Isochrysis_galbana.AAC.3